VGEPERLRTPRSSRLAESGTGDIFAVRMNTAGGKLTMPDLASSSIFIVPMTLVWSVLMGFHW